VTRLLALLLLAGCATPQIQSSKQTSKQESSQESAQDQQQQSAHQSESKQGTNSMPVIIICNTNNSPNAHCVAPPKDQPALQALQERLRKGAEK